jgi:hypothetical protein
MDTWKAAGPLVQARNAHTATLLPDGDVLVCGGEYEVPLSTAEVFNPATGSSRPTGSMFYERTGHTAALLPDGKVIVAGGTNSPNTEIYDPKTGEWRATGRLNIPRLSGHAMDRMSNGRVLVCGGYYPLYELPFSFLSVTEEYDPVTEVWSIVGAMSVRRDIPNLVALLDGRVLVVGGDVGTPTSTAELYDPQSRTWSRASDPFSSAFGRSATRLADGRVLVAGGVMTAALNACELFVPSSGNWLAVGKLHTARYSHGAALIHDGRVLITGGATKDISTGAISTLNSSEVFDPEKLVWRSGPDMGAPRISHTESPLRDRVIETRIERHRKAAFVAGGAQKGPGDAGAEVYEIDAVPVNQ